MKSVFFKSYIVLVVVMFLAMLATLIITDNLLEDVDSNRFITEASAEYRLLQSEILSQNAKPDSAYIESYTPTFALEVTLFNLSELPEKTKKELLSATTVGVFTGVGEDPWTYLVTAPNSNMIFSFAEQEEGGFSDVPTEDWLEFLIPICALFLVMGLGIFFLARKLISPVNHLTGVATELGDGNFEVRADVEKAKPITILANSFNLMADRVSALVSDQQVIIGAIPHELRTPLARARFAVDLTRDKESLAELKKQIEQVDSSLDDLDRMVQTTLQLTRLKEGGVIHQESFDLLDVLHHSVASCHNPNKHNIDIVNESETEDANVSSSASLLGVVIDNLLRNAVTHANSSVVIRVEESLPNSLKIVIEDDGNGIPDISLNDVFKPFFRLDESRNRNTGGVGLGLAIVQLIIDKLSLRITASNTILGGAKFVIDGVSTVTPKNIS